MVVVQGNPLNRSRIATVVCVPLTSNRVCIGRLGLLPALFGVITIPDAVFHEIAVANPDAPGASDVRTASFELMFVMTTVSAAFSILEKHEGCQDG